ncbi:MAG: phage tail protein [Alphaproteobacteria bacterium]|nr:phage tail protein [Alphaproteobacteria bacterium]
MATTAQKTVWLAEVEQAIQDLAMGRSVASVSNNGKAVTYTRADLPMLQARKTQLEIELGLARRAPMRPYF